MPTPTATAYVSRPEDLKAVAKKVNTVALQLSASLIGATILLGVALAIKAGGSSAGFFFGLGIFGLVTAAVWTVHSTMQTILSLDIKERLKWWIFPACWYFVAILDFRAAVWGR